MWKRLQHPNVVPFLGISAEMPPFEIVYDWMEHGGIVDYVRRHPEVDRIGLVSEFCRRHLVPKPSVIAAGRGGGPSLPPLVQHSTRRLDGCESFGFTFAPFSGPEMNLMNSKAHVLIDKDSRARLTGFGLASIVLGNCSVASLPDASLTAVATWAAPEISEGGTLTKAGDVFAFGMVAAEVCTRGVSGEMSQPVYPNRRLQSASPSNVTLPCRVGDVLNNQKRGVTRYRGTLCNAAGTKIQGSDQLRSTW